jgi:hypothetical protein
MPALLVAETVEDELGRAARLVVTLLARDEIEPRRRHHPHAAETDLDARDVVEALVEDLARHGPAIVFQDDDAVLAGFAPGAVVERLGHEDPAAGIEAEGDRLDHVGLRREHAALEAIRQHHHLGGPVGGQGSRLLIGGKGQRRKETGKQHPPVHR